jgi:hypothetical protein
MSKAATLIGATALASLALLMSSVQPAAAATGSTAPHSASAQCGQGRITVNTTMQQVQSVAGVPPKATGQYVARRALVYRWVNQRWELAVTGRWLWSYVTDGQSTSTFRTYDTSQVATDEFTVAPGQYYGVVVQFYWYSNADVGTGSDSLVAQHVDMGGPSNGYCKA